MRKRLTAALIALQLAFAAGLVAYSGAREDAVLTKGTEYVFLTQDARLTPRDGGAALTVFPKGAVYHNHDETPLRDNQYFPILTLANDSALFDRLTDKKPEGDYVRGTQRIGKEVMLPATFLDQNFPGWRNTPAEGVIDLTRNDSGHTFLLKARVWRGQIRFTDLLMDGESVPWEEAPQTDRLRDGPD